MRHLFSVLAALLAIAFAATSWSHHPAEGIVSDDIWEKVDDLLAETPHLDIDFEDVMGTMAVVEDPSGRYFLTTTIVVDDEDLADYLAEINTAIAELALNRVPSGATVSDTALLLDVYYTDNEFDSSLEDIILYEPVGGGESQDDMVPKQKQGN
jgi:hypothetical protein